MPGILLSATSEPVDQRSRGRFDHALKAMCFDERYTAHGVFAEPQLQAGWTGYPGYPVAVYHEAGFTLLLEGRIYAAPFDLRSTLIKEARRGLSPDVAVETIKRLTDDADGDFVVVVIIRDEPPRVVVAADRLGRLPLYWSVSSGGLAVAREVKAVARLTDRREPDHRAIAESLLFAFPLSDRTLLAGVQRLLPGGILQWPQPAGRSLLVSTRLWDFSESPPSGLDYPEAVTQCTERIIEACRRRLSADPDNQFVLSLSGGLDSRIAAAALQRLGAHVRTRTFLYGHQYREFEADCARRVAETLRLQWAPLRLGEPDVDRRLHHVAALDGLNTAALAFSDEYLRALLAESDSPVTLISGAGGDLILPPRHPHRHLHAPADVADLLLYRSAVLPLEQVAAVTGQPTASIRDRLIAAIAEYPEQAPAAQYLHFCLLGFEFKNHFVGEDRNRRYLWTLSPFYAHPLFAWAMALPYRWKRYRKFNTAILNAFDKRLTRIPSANTGMNPGSLADRARQRLRDWTLAHPTAERQLRRWRSRKRPSLSNWEQAQAALLQSARDSAHVRTQLDIDGVEELMAHPLTETQYWLLFTVVHYLRSLDCRENS